MGDKTYFTVAYEIPSPKPETVVLLPKSNWERLITRIKSIKKTNTYLHTIMGIFGGFSGSALIYYFSLPTPNHTWPMPLLGIGALSIFILSLVSTFLCFFIIKNQESVTNDIQNDIIDEMNVLGERFTINREI